MAVVLALDLVLKDAAGLGQLAGNNKRLSPIDGLAQLGAKADFLTDRELM